MNVLVALLTLVLLGGVILLVSSPLLAARTPRDAVSAQLAELRTEREAKYRELRDLELDYSTGKLSREDFEATDATLRAEALQILNQLELSESEPDHESEPDQSEPGSEA